MSSLISVNKLSRYYGDFCAVNDISFELAAGDILGFLGPNGAGKSSTMQMLSGNLAPSAGEIHINGIDLLEQPKAAKASLGYLPETPPLYPEMTVSEYLRYCARLHRITAARIADSCNNAMQRCGLTEVAQRLIRNLSKGYQQRVGIAQAILHAPPVIILDEPTVGLDPIQIMEIRDLIRELGQSHGIILCTHILPEVQAVCNRVQIINRGKLVYNANMNELLQPRSGRYEFILAKDISDDELATHAVFSEVEKVAERHFVVSSPQPAEQLTQFIIDQQWGLRTFQEKQVSLEQIFIELTAGDTLPAADEAA